MPMLSATCSPETIGENPVGDGGGYVLNHMTLTITIFMEVKVLLSKMLDTKHTTGLNQMRSP
jgi:hypothetical protein